MQNLYSVAENLNRDVSPLRARLTAAQHASGMGKGDLSVLSARRDPYRLDTPAMHRDASWLARQMDHLSIRLPVHLRGLHYALVVVGNILKPDGKPYKNVDVDWVWLSETAAKAARWLGYVPFESIVDNRNEAPTVYVPGISEARAVVTCPFYFQLPDPDDIEPYVSLTDFQPRQPFRICLCGEKASLRDVLLSLANQYEAEVVLPTGDMSDTLIYGIATRALADGRPLVVLYLADFDPSGWQMPICVSRKLQALRDLMPGLPWIQVHRVGLLDTHVRSLNLPSTPLKETEKRADGWRSHWGLEQTEIDALAALRPENLLEIVEKAIEPFWDKSLTRRTYRAQEAWKQKADKVLAASVDGAFLDRARDQLTTLIEGIRPQLEKLQASLEIDTNELDLPPIPEVLPDLDGLPSPSEALFDSRNDWTTATLRLTADRSHTAETP